MAAQVEQRPQPSAALEMDDARIDGTTKSAVLDTPLQAPVRSSDDPISDNEPAIAHPIPPPYQSNLPTAEPTTRDPVAEPKVKRTVQYRQIKDDTIVFTRSFDEEENLRTHVGTVFEIFDVNMTAETGDTKGTVEDARRHEAGRSVPTVSWISKQFIRIYSPVVLNALRTVVNYYPRHSIDGDHAELEEPYAMLVHYWDELKDYREKFRPEILAQDDFPKDCTLTDTYEHLGYLLSFLEDMWGERVRREKQRWAQPVPTATFEMLWLLLKPGTDVYIDFYATGVREPFVMSHCEAHMFKKAITMYGLRVWCLAGGSPTTINPEHLVYNTLRFDGEKPIDSLDIFPCQYLKGQEQRRLALIKRGRTYHELRLNRCMFFDGESSTYSRQKASGIRCFYFLQLT